MKNFFAIDTLLLYKICVNSVSEINLERVEDSFGNSIDTFLVGDDIALSFAIDNSGNIRAVWICE